MSDNLNEKFETMISEGGQDPMPVVPASVIPGQGSEPTQSRTQVNAKAGGHDPMPSVPTSVVKDQSDDEIGGSTNENPGGTENLGAKASAKNSKVGGAVSSKGGDPMPSVPPSVVPGKAVKEEKEKEEKHEDEAEDKKLIKKMMKKEDINVTDDVNALLNGEDLSESFKEKATTIFEAALLSKLNEQITRLEEEYAQRLQEEVEAIKTSLSEEVDGTLNYVIEKWVEENQLSIDMGIKSEITESFILGLKNVFEEHYIDIPEDKIDVVDTMTEEFGEMEQRLNEQIERNIELNNTLNQFVKERLQTQIAEGLADTQKEKFKSLSEGIEFTDETSYREKLVTVKESYFPKTQTASETIEEPLNEDYSPAMSAYLKAISRNKSF